MIKEKYTMYDQSRFEITKELILNHITSIHPKILDIGCGSGELLKRMPFNYDYIGIDDKQDVLNDIQRLGALTIKLDIENNPIPLQEKFDVVICTEVLEHMKFPEKILSEIQELVKDNGVVIISLPNEYTLWCRLGVIFGKGIDYQGLTSNDHHKHFPTVKQSKEIVEKYFDIIKVEYRTHIDVYNGLEGIMALIPYSWMMFVSEIFPSLFARGIIMVCTKK